MTKTIKRRRRERKTDYKARFALLKSGKPRLVIRKTNKYIIAQIVETNLAQDKIVYGTTSKQLLSQGWSKSGSLKSLKAAYQIGFLLGQKMKGKVDELILDTGMHRNIHKSRIYAVLKGAVDAGLNIPHNKDVLPTIEESQIEQKPKRSKKEK